MDDQLEQLVAGHQLLPRPAGHAAFTHRSLGMLGGVLALGAAVTADLATDRRGAAVEHSGNGPLAHAAQQTDLDVGALFNAEFVVRHGNTVPTGQVLHSVFATALYCAFRLYTEALNMNQQHQTASRHITTSALPELWTMADVERVLRRTRSGVDKLRARDPQFPKPLKDGDKRGSRIYFVRQEVEAYLSARLSAREEA